MGSPGEFRPPASIFVGRESELAELRAGLDEAIAGRGRMFLVSGEPGIGKTRLSNELASHAASIGARVIWGRCWQGPGAPAYWPWIQIVRTCLGAGGSGALDALLGTDRCEVSEQLPELAPRRRSPAALPQLRALPSADAEEARFWLFDSAARLLMDAAVKQPMMLVLDDLHDADQPSLLMLRFVARELGTARILAIGTFRDTEVRRVPALGKLIGDLSREGKPIPLAGLSEAEVARFVEGNSGTSPSPALVAKLYRASAGNPLFLDGIVRVLRAKSELPIAGQLGPSDLQAPEGVREAIVGRLAALSGQTNGVLSIASVIGLEFDLDCLQGVSGDNADAVLESLDEAQREGIIVAAELPQRRRFSHGLIRETLYDEIPTGARLRMHQCIAQILEESYAANLQPHLAELAHHYRRAAPLGEAAKAIDYSISAGEAAFAVFAPEEAAAQWQAALELLGRQEHTEERRAHLCMRLIVPMGSIDPVKCLDYGAQALRLFEDLRQTKWAVSAHLAVGRILSERGPQMDLRRGMEHFRKAKNLLSGLDEDFSTRISVHIDCGLAAAAHNALRTGEGLAASRRAIEAAQRLADAELFAHSAYEHAKNLFLSGRLAEAFALLERLWETADLKDDAATAHGAAAISGSFNANMSEHRAARMWYERELAKPRTKAPFWRGLLRTNLAQALVIAGEVKQALPLLAQAPAGFADLGNALLLFWQGRWAEAESLWARSMADFRNAGGRNFSRSLSSWVLRLQGKYEANAAFLLDMLSLCREEPLEFPEIIMSFELALLYAETGRPEQAAPHLARCREIMAAGEEWKGMAGMVLMAEAVVEAALCYQRGSAGGLRGSTAVRERFQGAQALFAKAIEIFTYYQVRWDHAETLYQWGRALIAAGRDSDGAAKLDEAVEFYRRHGAGQPWIDRALAAKANPSAASITTPTHAEEARAIFRREGDYWTVAFDSHVSRLKDAKGLRYLTHLLRNPGVEFSVVDLAPLAEAKSVDPLALPSVQEAGTQTRRDLGDAGPMLDAQAKADYCRRLGELSAELEEAERFNDPGRAQRLRVELEAVTAELAAAVERGGRDRRAASHIERARSMVSKRIRFSIGQIQRANTALGRHLTQSIRTGYHCTYAPKQNVDWQF